MRGQRQRSPRWDVFVFGLVRRADRRRFWTRCSGAYGGEDLADIEATVEHVKACRPDVFLTTVSYPIKGTPYYGEVAPRLVRLGEWATSTDRDTSIRGRHSRRFYQLADLLLKNEVAGLTAEAGDARRQL